MKVHEDRSHMNIDTRWFEKGYAKEDVHSLRLQSLCTEAEATANKQFYDSHTHQIQSAYQLCIWCVFLCTSNYIRIKILPL